MHAKTMHTPADADWAKSLYDQRFKRIKEADDSPQQSDKLGRAKAALLATLDELTDAHAVLAMATRRVATNVSCFDRKLRHVRHTCAERAMLAAFMGPDTLAATLQRTGVSTHEAFVTRRELRRRA